ncbi:MAG: serine protease, partial [bacterium]
MTQRTGLSLLADEVKSELRKVEKSVVGVNAEAIYEIQKFHYVTRDGDPVPDPTSPLKYQLAAGDGSGGITTEEDLRVLSGGGLIMDVERKDRLYVYTILTSNHLVSPQDTTNVYYVDENGIATDILFARFVLKSLRVAVRIGNAWSSEADLIANSPADDLAIIRVKTSRRIGPEFENRIGYALDLSWGDWVFVFGYPQGIKQMTGGWVSKSPYPRTMAVDAVVRLGYSGGPVFSLAPDNQLVFVGLIKSVPRTTLDYVGFDKTIPVGASLEQDDLQKLSTKQKILVNYGTAYFVRITAIKA